MKQFAKHILAVANENNINVTNLQLQKVMYFSMKETDVDKSLLDDMYDYPFQVWRFGPTVKEVHSEYKPYVTSPILESGQKDDKFNVFNETILELLNHDPFDLVERSKNEEFWKENESKIIGGRSEVSYELDDVLRQEVEIDLADIADNMTSDNGLQM